MDQLWMSCKNLTDFMLGELSEIQDYFPPSERVKANGVMREGESGE